MRTKEPSGSMMGVLKESDVMCIHDGLSMWRAPRNARSGVHVPILNVEGVCLHMQPLIS